jgi:hypothetical protein
VEKNISAMEVSTLSALLRRTDDEMQVACWLVQALSGLDTRPRLGGKCQRTSCVKKEYQSLRDIELLACA